MGLILFITLTKRVQKRTKSIWKAKAPDSVFAPLEEDIEVDVAIVGGGITGITTAYFGQGKLLIDQ